MSGVRTVDHSEVECRGCSDVEVVVRGMRLRLRAIVINHMVDGIDVVIGMDTIVCL